MSNKISVDELVNKVHSKYGLVMIVAKRARDMKNEKVFLKESYDSKRHIGKALEEINEDLFEYDIVESTLS